MNRLVIVDIDGTISKPGKRLKYLKQDKPDWDSFYNDCFDDEPILEMIDLVNILSAHYRIIFCTGRRESIREKTEAWISKWLGLEDYVLLMRPD